jgi:uncharacterized integral membrane protein (TIGR00697 family)
MTLPHHLSRKQTLFLVLSGIFITNAVLAELIGVKIFSVEKTLGIAPAHIKLWGDTPFDFNLTAGVMIWPVVFITTDIINEYFGMEGVKKVSYLTAALILYSFFAIWLVTGLPAADFWLELNSKDAQGRPFDMNFAFSSVYRQGLGIIIGSLVAFLIGQILDATVFQYLKKLTGSRRIWLRATGSTLVSQFIDSFLVLWIAFYVFGNWSMSLVLSVGVMNYLYKFVVAILITPVLYLVHAVIEKYLGLSEATEIV